MPSLYDTVQYNTRRGGLTDGLDSVYRTIKQSEANQAQLDEQGRQFDVNVGLRGRDQDLAEKTQADSHALGNRTADNDKHKTDTELEAAKILAASTDLSTEVEKLKVSGANEKIRAEVQEKMQALMERKHSQELTASDDLNTLITSLGYSLDDPKAAEDPRVIAFARGQDEYSRQIMANIYGGTIQQRVTPDKDGGEGAAEMLFIDNRTGKTVPLAERFGGDNNPAFANDDASVVRRIRNKRASLEALTAQAGATGRPKNDIEGVIATIEANNPSLGALRRQQLEKRGISLNSDAAQLQGIRMAGDSQNNTNVAAATKDAGLRQGYENVQTTADRTNTQAQIEVNDAADKDTVDALLSEIGNPDDPSSYSFLDIWDADYEIFAGETPEIRGQKMLAAAVNSINQAPLALAQDLGYGVKTEDEAAKLLRDNPEARKRAIRLVITSMKNMTRDTSFPILGKFNDLDRGEGLPIYRSKKDSGTLAGLRKAFGE